MALRNFGSTAPFFTQIFFYSDLFFYSDQRAIKGDSLRKSLNDQTFLTGV